VFGIKADNRAWVDSLRRAQPLATFEAPALLNGGGDQVKNRTYILADSWDPSPFRHFAAQCEATPGWKLVKMPSSHAVMVDTPHELAQEFIKLV
jgi:hypothetical protein